MKLPSINQILQGALRTFSRFPFVLCAAIAGTVSGVTLADYEGPGSPTILFKILFASILGIPLLLGLALTAEKRKWTRLTSLGVQASGIALLVVYAFTVPATLSAGPVYHVQRLLALAVAAHLFVSVGPYLRKGEENGFWQYNKTLLFRILGAALYSHILYAGLSLALAALDQLFGIDIPGKRYGELWIVTFGILNTWLFLAAIPENLDELDAVAEYPNSLRILVQYALAPLAAIYMVIVYAYVAKIAFTLEWSEGWISKLILGFSVTGILSLLLLYPLRNRNDMRWVRPLFQWFYVVMVPLVIVFPLALVRRMSEYGITEGRYAAAAIAVWLVFVVVYFLMSKGKSIKVIPASFGIMALAVCYGPWGMFQVSEESQTKRLYEILVRDSIFVDGTIEKSPMPVAYEDSKQISSILDYLHVIHGLEGIQPWFRERLLKDTSDAVLGWKEPSFVAGIMGVEYVRLWVGGGNYATFTMDQEVSVDIRGYERLIRFQYMGRGGVKKEVPEEQMRFRLSGNLDTLTIMAGNVGAGERRLELDLLSVASSLVGEYSFESVANVPPEKMIVTGSADGIRAKVYIRSIQVRRRGEEVEVNDVSVDIVYSK